MQRKYWLSTLLLLAVAALPAVAEEIVYFNNGTSMPVQAYSIEDGTIRLDLGDQAYVAFPVEQIDRIETTEGVVRNTNSVRANKIVGGGPTGSTPAHYRQVHSRNAPKRQRTENVVERRNGIAVNRPFANHPAPNRRQFTTVAGGRGSSTSGANQGGVIGTTPFGPGFTLERRAEGSRKSQLVGIESK